jgi:alkylated DNA nucleotide flippase Atl1
MSNELNERLRAALRPVDPGERFTQGVLARIAGEPARVPASAHRSVRRLELRWLSGALLAVVAAGFLVAHQWRAQHAQQGQEARRQVMEALRVTSEKLDLAWRVVKDKEHSGA